MVHGRNCQDYNQQNVSSNELKKDSHNIKYSIKQPLVNII